MSQHIVDPKFSDLRFLLPKLCGDGMAERMERHSIGKTEPFLCFEKE